MEPPGWGALLLSEPQEHMPAQRGMQSSNRNTRKGHSPAQRHRACLRGKCIPVKIEVHVVNSTAVMIRVFKTEI